MNKSLGIKILIIILVLLIIVAGVLLAMRILKQEEPVVSLGQETINEVSQTPTVEEEYVPKIFNGDKRPVAVMIDNHKSAMPQANLDKAYIVYEIIVEGGETRLMAVYKGQDDLDKIGPIRSSRHYFLDYALENDAIYVHYGWSPQAQSDIKKLGINNINGITESSTSFWRANDKYAPHNAVSDMENVMKIAERKEYRTTSSMDSLFNYVEEVNLESENSQTANAFSIEYSQANTVRYEYDAENKVYNRYARNKAQTDLETKEPITAKNIIITFCDNYTLQDSENKGRQGLKNIGEFDGYYITNGKAIKITCNKSSRTAKTIYKDLNGNEIEVNDGNTFIQICPINADVEIEE